MSIIEQWDAGGHRRPIDLSEALRHLDPGPGPAEPAPLTSEADSFVWIALDDADAADLTAVVDHLHLEARVVRSLEHFHRPSSEELSQGHYLALATLWFSPDGALVETGQIHCLLTVGGIITMERGRAGITEQAAAILQTGPSRTIQPAAVLRAIATAVVNQADAVTDDLGEAVAELETEVFSTAKTDPVERIYLLKREVAEARRALGPVALALRDVAAADSAPVGKHDRGSVRQLVTHVDRCADQVEGYDRMLGDMLQAHLAIVSVRQNEDMRRMSAWAAIAAVCTVIAGIYGMNFVNMPELQWAWGYAWAVGLMATAGLVLYRAFKRSGWL